MLRRYLLKRRHRATLRRLWAVMAGARERHDLAEDVERLGKSTRHLTAELEPLEVDWLATETMETLEVDIAEQETAEYAY